MGVPLYQAKAEFFRTLGHPARIRVLELLSEAGSVVYTLALPEFRGLARGDPPPQHGARGR